MSVRYVLKQLFLLPGGLLLLCLLGAWLREYRPAAGRFCLLLGLAGLTGMCLPVSVDLLARRLETEPPLVPERWAGLHQEAGAIVVLGGGRESGDPAWGMDQPGYIALERLRYAARLARASGLPLLVSGGLHFGRGPSEARIAAGVAREDFSVTVRWLEEQSRTTWENALFSARLLQGEGISRVVLVTSAWHMRRARWCFERNGLQVVAAPVGFWQEAADGPAGGWLPEAKAFWQSRMLFNEALGLQVYPWLYGGAATAQERL